jgi:hypothetical protein
VAIPYWLSDGPDAIRTHDLRLVKATSFQLDHGPTSMDLYSYNKQMLIKFIFYFHSLGKSGLKLVAFYHIPGISQLIYFLIFIFRHDY